MAQFHALAFVLVSMAAIPCSSAQGNVLVVDDGSPAFGGGWTFDLDPDATLDDVAALPVLIEVSDRDHYGATLASLGDLNGDGNDDLVVGSTGEDRAGIDVGALWILFLGADGSVASKHALRPGRNFRGEAGTTAFGTAVASLGDLDGDGTLELALGAKHTQGAIWILSLEPDGAVAREVVLSEGNGGFGGALDPGDDLGRSLAAVGDLDGDGIGDLVAGGRGDDDGASSAGALWILFLNADATVKASQKISNTSGLFGGVLDAGDFFGSSVASLGDLDGNGTVDLAVGALFDDDGGLNKGALWILFLASDGTVVAEQKISATAGGLGALAEVSLGSAVAQVGDLDADDVPDLVAGASNDGVGTGAVVVLFLNADGTVKAKSVLRTEFPGVATGDQLGASLAYLGDRDEDGRPDLAVGAVDRAGSPPPPDFTDLEDALAAAAPGDTILVRGGEYVGPFLVSARSLTIQAANPLNATVFGLRVEDLSASQSVRLSGLRLTTTFTFDDGVPALELENNAGVVWIDDCVVPGGNDLFNSVGPGMRANDSPRVVLNRCRVTSYNGGHFDYRQPPAPALVVMNGSAVHAYDCTFTGAPGKCGTEIPFGFQNPQPGGTAIVTTSPLEFLFLSGCVVQGGSGQSCGCDNSGWGMQIAGQARILDTSIVGGAGCFGGGPWTGSVTVVPGERLSMTVDNPRRKSEDTLYFVEGPPDRDVWVQYALTPGVHHRPLRHGTDLLGNPRTMDYLGRTDAEGRLVVFGAQNDPPPGFDVLRVFAQSFTVAPHAPTSPKVRPYPPRIWLGTGAMITRLDSAF